MQSFSNAAPASLYGWATGSLSSGSQAAAGKHMAFCVDQVRAHLFGEAVIQAVPDFQQLVDDHYVGLYRFAQSLCRRQGLAEDLVQQTYLQWARKGSALRDLSKVKSWLYTTLYREWLAIARKEKRFEAVEFDPEQHAIEEEDVKEEPPVDSGMLQRALDELDGNSRAVLVLFYLKELSYREIADVINAPIGTVMSRLSRAKDALRSILKRMGSVAQRTVLNKQTA